MTESPALIDKLVSFDQDRTTNDLIIKHEQHIPDEFVSALKAEKVTTTHERMGEFYRVASIPVSVVEDLKRRYNFDVMTEPVQETLKMLKRLDLDAFVTTNKRV